MAFYLLKAGGYQDASFPWNITACCTSSQSEAAVATAWNTGWTTLWTNFGPMTNTTTALTYTSASTASPTFKQTTMTRTTRNNSGTAAGTPLPMHSAVVLTLRTAQMTKWGHGRWYLPSPNAGALASTGYVLAPASVTAVVTGVNGLMTALHGVCQLVILHRKNTLHGPLANTTDLITTGDVSNILHVQKRRGRLLTPTRSAIAV